MGMGKLKLFPKIDTGIQETTIWERDFFQALHFISFLPQHLFFFSPSYLNAYSFFFETFLTSKHTNTSK